MELLFSSFSWICTNEANNLQTPWSDLVLELHDLQMTFSLTSVNPKQNVMVSFTFTLSVTCKWLKITVTWPPVAFNWPHMTSKWPKWNLNDRKLPVMYKRPQMIFGWPHITFEYHLGHLKLISEHLTTSKWPQMTLKWLNCGTIWCPNKPWHAHNLK